MSSSKSQSNWILGIVHTIKGIITNSRVSWVMIIDLDHIVLLDNIK